MQDASEERDLNQAIASLDATKTLALGLTEGKAGAERELAKTLWRGEALLDKRSAKNLSRRNAFLETVATAIEAADAGAAKLVRTLPATLDVIEEGYAKILERTRQCDGSSMAPINQVSAALSYAAKAFDQLEEMALQSLGDGPTLQVQPNISVDGLTIDPDAEMHGVLKSAVATIMMMAHTHRWLNADGEVVLPTSPVGASTAQIDRIKDVMSHARAWLSWERAQLRTRLDQRPIEYLAKPFPPEVPEEVENVIRVMPNERIELVDYIANDRLLSRTKQHMFELLQAENRSAIYPGLTKRTKLPPAAFISFEEKHGLITLSEGYSFNVAADTSRYAGLTIVQWLRGYAVLLLLAQDTPNKADKAHECPQLSEADLVHYLSRGGLPADRARVFIQHCCLSSRRSDVYDRPLIRIEGSRYLLVTPSIKSALLGPIVMSAIADAGAQVRRKGKAFEERLRKLLKDSGHTTASFTKKRDGEEYDYDALFVWGDFCFLMECKNRTLSGNILQLAHNTHREGLAHTAQVHRLVDGLLKHPDMLDADLPNARGKLLVPCVVNALPYSVPGGINGVYFTDYSSLCRFLASPTIGQVGYLPGEAPMRPKDGEIVRLWKGSAPTPTELLRHLECPFQYLLTRVHTGLQPILSALSNRDALLSGEYAPMSMSPDSGRAAATTFDAEYPLRTEAEWANYLRRIP